MAPLLDRTEFRKVVKEVAKCLRQNLDQPGVAPLSAEQIIFWMQSVTLEDLDVVMREIESEGAGPH